MKKYNDFLLNIISNVLLYRTKQYSVLKIFLYDIKAIFQMFFLMQFVYNVYTKIIKELKKIQ